MEWTTELSLSRGPGLGEGQERPPAPGTQKSVTLIRLVSRGGLLRGVSLNPRIGLNETCAFLSVPSTLQRELAGLQIGQSLGRGDRLGTGPQVSPTPLHSLARSRPSATT